MEIIDQGPVVPKEALAAQKVKSYSAWAAGAGVLPIPGVNLAVVAGVQLKMLNELSKIYDLPFSASLGKSLIATLVGTGSTAAFGGTAAMFLNMIPVVGHISMVLVQPALAAASTYAVGKVFIVHFESGGTFLDFNADAMREHYRTYFEASAQPVAARAPAKASA